MLLHRARASRVLPLDRAADRIENDRVKAHLEKFPEGLVGTLWRPQVRGRAPSVKFLLEQRFEIPFQPAFRIVVRVRDQVDRPALDAQPLQRQVRVGIRVLPGPVEIAFDRLQRQSVAVDGGEVGGLGFILGEVGLTR